MTRNELKELYFHWMYQLVSENIDTGKSSYLRLLWDLNRYIFEPRLEMDENRVEDGMNLRYRFGYEYDYDRRVIATYLDDEPCSILEMMVALCIRCEESIMDDPETGDRTAIWFWHMIDSLGLTDMDDDHYDDEKVCYILSRFVDRKYERDGRGGLFYIRNCKRDLRNVEIWYQMCWYLDDIITKGG